MIRSRRVPAPRPRASAGRPCSSTANGWTETNVAHAQTGYLRAGSKAPCTADSCPNFATAATAAVQAGVDLVIITGGANDLVRIRPRRPPAWQPR